MSRQDNTAQLERDRSPTKASIERVRGLQTPQLKQAAEYYFENKRRSGGGQINSFVPIETDGDIVDITFENEKDAKSVAERRHVINGISIEVSLLLTDVKTTFYRDRFLITGLQENISDDCLMYFIKSKTGVKPKFIVYHKDAIDVALVIMENEFDISQLLEDCAGETLEGAKLEISEVEISNVIHVSNLPDGIHNDMIMLYFESRKRSNGGTVKDVSRLDDTTCLVYFEDYEVLEGLFSRSHVLNKNTLVIRKYLQCVVQTEEEAINKRIPESIVVSDIDSRKFRFVQQNDRFKQTVEQESLSHYAQIDWPHEPYDNCEVKINSIVDVSTLSSNRVTMTWQKEIKELFENLMNRIYIHSITLKDFNYDDLCVECTADNGEELLICTDRATNMTAIVGTSTIASSTLKSACNSSGDANDEITKESVSIAHIIELKMLKSLEYESKITKQVPYILIKENEENLSIDFEGQPIEIRNAKLLMMEMKNEINTAFAYISTPLALQMYLEKPAIDFVNQNLHVAGTQCMWSVSNKKLVICCRKNCDLESCIDVIKSSVIDEDIDLKERVDVSDMDIVEAKLDELVKKYPEKVAKSKSGINAFHLCSTKDVREDVVNAIETAIQNLKERKQRTSEEFRGGSYMPVTLPTRGNLDIANQLEENYIKETIRGYKEIIKTLTRVELDQLEIVALADIKIDYNAGIITIEGPAKDTSEVTHELKMRLLKIQRQRNDAASAEELSKLVQWQYEEVTDKGFEYKLYDKGLNMKIEEAYKGNLSTFEFQDNYGITFVIDFNRIIEYDKADGQYIQRVARKDILKAVASALPDTWAEMKDNENIKIVQVPKTDKEYQDIETRFTTEVKTGSYPHRLNFDPDNLKVNKIERIQNRTLYQQYQTKKMQMKELKPNLASTLPYERELWHSTKQDAVANIEMYGFNRSYSGNANGEPWYGEGVYFAGNASYSARGRLSGNDSYSARSWLFGAHAGSKGYMFVVKALTGQLCQGKKGMRYLPQVNPKDPTILYDCAVDNLQNPLEFVIFNDTQAYPAYIITFTT